MFRWTSAIAGCIVLATVGGCGGSGAPEPADGVILTGKLVQGGNPIAVAPTPDHYNGPEIRISPLDQTVPLSETQAYPDEAGNFRIEYEGKGVPPAKYKMAVFVRQGGPDTDTLEGKLAMEKTTIEFEVPKDKLGSEHNLGTIDIAEHLK